MPTRGEPQPTRPSARVALPLSKEVEAELELARRRLRRNGIVIILVLDALIVAVGAAGASDLRSMETPTGTAAAWADAAATGDCDRYLDLETTARRAADLAFVTPAAATRKVTPRDELCSQVLLGWESFSTERSVLRSDSGGQALVELTTVAQPSSAGTVIGANGAAQAPSAGTTLTGRLTLRKVGGRWHVDNNPQPCRSPAFTPAAALCAVSPH